MRDEDPLGERLALLPRIFPTLLCDMSALERYVRYRTKQWKTLGLLVSHFYAYKLYL